MNKSLGTIIGIIVVLLIVGVGWLAVNKSTNPEPITPITQTPPPSPSPEPVTPPAPVQKLPIVMTDQIAVPSDTTVVVTGKVTPNGAFTNYWYEYGTSPSLGNTTSKQMIGSGFVAISAPAYITGLVKNTTYYFRLNAKNQLGTVAGAQYSFRTTQGTPPPVGSAPTTKTLEASGISRTTANLNGEVTPNKASTQFWFEYGQSQNLGNTTAFQSAGNGTAKLSESVSLSNLNPATMYYFRLNAQNQFGTVNGAILNFKTAGPAVATAPSVSTKNAIEVSTSTAMLRGMVNPNGAETMYWFEYGMNPLPDTMNLSLTEQRSAGAGVSNVSINADIAHLTANTNYSFRVVARNSVGTVYGERMTFKTK